MIARYAVGNFLVPFQVEVNSWAARYAHAGLSPSKSVDMSLKILHEGSLLSGRTFALIFGPSRFWLFLVNSSSSPPRSPLIQRSLDQQVARYDV